MEDFEQRHGWSPDCDYETIKSNCTPEEEARLLQEATQDIINKLTNKE